ncbi:MAG TPA: HesA/MoeB/ThiF family protein [Candidatus Hydrogenedentes bacterium]|nr:HesA/MoeB/ThiF family protein [Candidatus Hydrogenedentota bacterium]HQH53116.1 HesA/MoeB/ThiF family protein [Candidatus Hydrogenedentota bacterium]HQM47505.1 HesA/MoeB/ThiF family protein [Candidatus Hydrogenedentota bacterium]
MLSQEQRERYERNILVPGIGESGQRRLLDAGVCIVGLGGLGSAAALYLAAAGLGRLGLVDPDVLELSNLQRQVVHTTARLGMNKAESAAMTLRALNPDCGLQVMPVRITKDNAPGLLTAYDVVVEATDSFSAKFLVNDVCLEYGKPFATAGILALSGQMMFVVPGRTPCLRCAVSDEPLGVPTTNEQGVLGAVPGVLGSLEALAVVRYLAGLWKPQSDGAGAVHSIDGENLRWRTTRLPRNTKCCCAPSWSST